MKGREREGKTKQKTKKKRQNHSVKLFITSMARQFNNTNSHPSDGHTAGGSQRQQMSFGTIMKSRIRQPQFYWFLGHVMTLYHFLKLHLSLFNVNNQRYHYNRSLLYIIISFGIVLYQFIRSKQLNISNFFINLYKLDNLQYFTLYSILYLLNNLSGQKIILNGGIISPAIFSLFHILNYFKENLLPYLNMIPQRQMISSLISMFISNYNEKCLILAQSWEIILMFRYVIMSVPLTLLKFLISLIVFQRFNGLLFGQLIMILTYIKFIKWRYIANKQFSLIFNEMVRRMELLLNQYANGQFVFILPLWNQIKQTIIKYI